MSTLNIYGCGGAGINLASQLLSFQQQEASAGFCKVMPYLIDTSRSNIRNEAPSDQIYLFESLDGSGKKRNMNYSAISEKTREMLHKFKPSEINVVIHSASGGSGSVIGPLLSSELLAHKNVIVFLIGSADSRIEAENTVKTLKSYEMISKKREQPILLSYFQNSSTMSRAQVDKEIIRQLMYVSLFFSGENAELDSADLSNFLHYPRVTSWPVGLARLGTHVQADTFEGSKGETFVSCATLIDDQASSVLKTPMEYQAVGFIGEAVKLSLKSQDSIKYPLHLTASLGYFPAVIDSLEKRIEEFDSFRSTYVHGSALKEGDENQANDDGMVF